jgi:sigma-E factor negative regulatory protein RseB
MTRAARVLVRSLWRPALALMIGAAQPATADPTPEKGEGGWTGAQLARMAEAVEHLNYEGTLVYLSDNRLETLYIVHRRNGVDIEDRLLSLSGPLRAVTRRPDEVTCLLSDEHPISVKRTAGITDLLRARSIDAEALAANYFVHPLGATRVAGRETDVVGVIPRDGFRYGYRFYLDRETGLPLKSDLMGAQGAPIEQIMFAVVQIDPATPAPAAAAAEEVPERSAVALDAAPAGDPTGAWHFDALPPGFAVRMHDGSTDGGSGRTEHFLVSDHLASVSVFIERAGQGGLTGESRMGAVHAIGGRVAGHQVTVVGQVPPETVAAVLAGLRQDGEGTR